MRDEARGTAFALLTLAAATAFTVAAQAPPPVSAPSADKPAAAASCADCHAEQAPAFATNPHARAFAARNGATTASDAVCATCHGDGKAHMEAGGDASLIRNNKGSAGSDTCLTCHDSTGTNRSFRNGMHANSEAIHCQTCHSIHKSDRRQRHLLVSESVALCATCHGDAAASFREKPYAHKLGRGGLDCASCHEPHGRPGRASLKLTRAGELPCLSCHASQRGPHVFDHVSGVAGDCTSCHRPHGSSNPRQLTRNTVAALCLECHSPTTSTTLGSRPPATHDLLTPRWRNCTVCHTAVHGSNRSPKLLK